MTYVLVSSLATFLLTSELKKAKAGGTDVALEL